MPGVLSVISSCYLPGQSSRHVADGNQDICGGHVYDQAIRYGIESTVPFHGAYQ